MRIYNRIASSTMIGLSTGAFLGCYYGWSLMSANADNMSEQVISFIKAKTWMMSISIAGFVSLATYLGSKFDISVKRMLQ